MSETITSFQIKIDAVSAVLDIEKGKLMEKLTPHKVEPGVEYEVSVKSNAYYHNRELPVKKVVIYNTTNNNPNGWFYIVEEGHPQVIKIGEQGTQHNEVYAFFIDITSQDNTGSATITFSPLC